MTDYSKDNIARYLAMRVIKNKSNPNIGLEYEKAITSPKTTKEAIDWWIEELEKNDFQN